MAPTQPKEHTDENSALLDKFHQALEHSPVSVLITDAEGNIEYVNPAFTKVTGYSSKEAVGRNPNMLQSGQTPAQTYQTLWRTIKAGEVWQGELMNKRKNGELYWERVSISYLKNGDGEITNFIALNEDLTERKQFEKAIQEANLMLAQKQGEINKLQLMLGEHTIRDSLTGLYNRRFLDEVMGYQINFAARRGKPLSLIVMDIDHFQKTNDIYGQHAGDAVLVGLSELLKDNLRRSDYICRGDGEAFLIALPDCELHIAARNADLLRRLFGNMAFEFDGRKVNFTLSSGIAGYPDHGDNFPEMLKKAGQALDASKSSGRDRVTVWQAGTDERPD